MGQSSSTPSRNERASSSSSSPHSSPNVNSNSRSFPHDPMARSASPRHPSSQPSSLQSPSPSSPSLPPPSSTSRVLRSVTERRRRTNLFSSFYPLLSRSSSSTTTNNNNNNNNNNSNNGSSSPEATTSEIPASNPSSLVRSTRTPPPVPSGRTPRGLHRVQRLHDEPIRSYHSSRASSLVAVPSPDRTERVENMDVDPVSGPLPPPSTAQSDVIMAPSHPTESTVSNPSATPTEPFDTTNTHAFESLLVGLSNPRGTSISSSLLPIRPDSDDEDFYNREDQDFSRPGRQPSRGRPGPDLVADLIQHQFAQHESSTPYHPATTPREPTQTVAPQQELNNSDASVERREPTEIPSAAQHRRRLRSSSLRGVMGFQPTGTVSDDPMSTITTPDNSERTEATRPSVDRAPFIPSQLHFLTRLLTDISRGPEGEGRDSPTGPDVSSNSSSTQDDEATPPRRRPPTTIRLIQVGGLGFGRPRETGSGVETTTTTGETTGETTEAGSTMTGTTGTTGDTANGSTTGLNPSTGDGTAPGSGSEETTGEGARLEEAMGEAFIVFLSSPNTEPESETENTREGRPRAPWVVVSFSGAYLSSLMAGAVNEGVSYEDLWMLSNLIGPARPITTTQEAINSAGFHVGQYEHEVQGMRGCSTLGDGSRCLVCMSEYEEGEDMRALKCRHGFHQECIDKWLTTGANKCPICRAAAVDSESEAPVPEVGVEE
ncbi:hypothetical protein BG005_009939 [Podila minutissima]|nr:hypothetical protein BG005_009939 [Podila minutissima]